MFRKSLLATIISAIGLGIAANTASAIQFTAGPTEAAADWQKQWVIEGRVGATGGADYEFAIGPEGAHPSKTGEIYTTWTNGQDINWSLNWNGTTAAFTAAGKTIQYTPDLGTPTIDAILFHTRATTETGKVAPGTSIFFAINQVNGIDLATPLSSISTSLSSNNGKDFDQFSFLSDTPISSLSGTARISWLTGNPTVNGRGRVAFQLKGFDAPNVPEASNVLGLIAVGGAMIAIRRAN